MGGRRSTDPLGPAGRSQDTSGHAAFRTFQQIVAALPGDPTVGLEGAASSGLQAVARRLHGLYGDAYAVLYVLASAAIVSTERERIRDHARQR